MALSPENARLRDAASDRLFTAFEQYGARVDYDQDVAEAMTALIDARTSVDDVTIGPWLERVAIATTSPNELLNVSPTPVAPSSFGLAFAVGAIVAVGGTGAWMLYRTFSKRGRRRRR